MKDQNWLILGPVSIVCGTIAAVLTHFFYQVAVFAAGAIGGGLLGKMLVPVVVTFLKNQGQLPTQLDSDTTDGANNMWWVTMGVWALFGLIGGVVAVKVLDPALRILTAFIGSFLATTSAAYFIEMLPALKNEGQLLFLSWNTLLQKEWGQSVSLWDQHALWCFVGWGVLGMIGVLVQYKEREIAKKVAAVHHPRGRRETDMYRSGGQERTDIP